MSLRSVLASVLVGIAAASAHADAPSISMSGKWNSDFGLAEMTENGGQVTGSFPHEDGRIIGTRSGNRLTGRWIQSTSSRKCDTAVEGSYFHGRFEFDFTANEFVGRWSYCDDAPAAQWSGKRVIADADGTAAAPPAAGLTPCPGCPPWVARSFFTANFLPLWPQAEVWSDPKPFSRNSAQFTVQSRFMEQHGTTCKFEVQFNNVGAKAVDESFVIARPGKAAVGNNDAPLRAKLAPGAFVAYATEVRECPLIWGKSKDMAKCAACEPMVYFVAD